VKITKITTKSQHRQSIKLQAQRQVYSLQSLTSSIDDCDYMQCKVFISETLSLPSIKIHTFMMMSHSHIEPVKQSTRTLVAEAKISILVLKSHYKLQLMLIKNQTILVKRKIRSLSLKHGISANSCQFESYKAHKVSKKHTNKYSVSQ